MTTTAATRLTGWEVVEQDVDHMWKFKIVNKATGKCDGTRWQTREWAEKGLANRIEAEAMYCDRRQKSSKKRSKRDD